MANNPLYDNSFRHYLNFKKPNYGRVEITEPINFDAFSFKIKQANDRFGRDKEIGAEEIDLEFIKVFAKECGLYALVDVPMVNHLSHRIDLIFEALNENGSESEIEYILTKNNIDFVVGLLDIPESTTDGYSSFKCSVIQNTNKALIERKKDVVVDVFKDKDTFNNYIAPVSKQKILLKSKPFVQVSEWKGTGSAAVGSSVTNNRNEVTGNPDTDSRGANNAQVVVSYGIENTLSFFKSVDSLDSLGNPLFDNFSYIESLNQLTNLQISITELSAFTRQIKTDFLSNIVLTGSGYVRLVVKYGFDLITAQTIVLYEKTFGFTDSTPIEYLPTSFDVNIPFLNIGDKIWIYLQPFSEATFNQYSSSSLANYSVFATMESMNVKIKATSTSIDSVIDGVAYFDFLKQGVKSLSGLNIKANDIESGEFDGQYIFNGNLIRQKDNSPLNFVFKDEMNDLKETNSDYQIFDDRIEILQYPDFYNYSEMGAFIQVPDVNFERKYNDRFKKITLNYGFKTFEQDRNEENTVDAFHTQSQFLFPNKQVEGDIKVDINHIRDPFTIESARREAISSTTALTTDEKIFIIDCVALPDGSINSITAPLQMQVQENGMLFIRSENFKWTLLGFENGDTINITSGENIGQYAVLQHSDTILELVANGGQPDPTFSGLSTITIVYPLTGVSLTNRTDEGFDIIEGIESPERCSNLKYTIKRNLSRNAWGSYLSSIAKDTPDGIIINTDFKVNGDLTTQFEGGDILTEKADIAVNQLPTKILNKYEYKSKVIASFEQAKQLIEDIVSVRGFIRIMDTDLRIIRVFPKQIDYIWADGVMEVVGEGLNENEYVSIFETPGGVNIIDIGYDEVIDTSLEWFKIDNGYVQIFDNKQIPLINPTHFTKIRINGEIYLSDIEFYKTLDKL